MDCMKFLVIMDMVIWIYVSVEYITLLGRID